MCTAGCTVYLHKLNPYQRPWEQDLSQQVGGTKRLRDPLCTIIARKKELKAAKAGSIWTGLFCTALGRQETELIFTGPCGRYVATGPTECPVSA